MFRVCPHWVQGVWDCGETLRLAPGSSRAKLLTVVRRMSACGGQVRAAAGVVKKETACGTARGRAGSRVVG